MKRRSAIVSVFLATILVFLSVSLIPVRSVSAEEEKSLYTRLIEAKQKLDEVKEKEAEGSLGFFKWHNPDSEAVTIIEERLEVQDNDSWGNIALGEEGDATSLDNMYEALLFIKEGNDIRANDGHGETYALKISDELMAVAQVQTTNSKRIMAHSRMYGVTENLAWGYHDPYDIWYSEEKARWYNGVTGWDVAHFLNMINPGGMYSSRISTGFAVVTRGTVYGATHGQTFGTSSTYPDAVLYTYDEYLEDFLTYREELKKELEEAQKNYDALLKEATPELLGAGNSEKGIDLYFRSVEGADSYIIYRESADAYSEIARVRADKLSSFFGVLCYTDETAKEDSLRKHNYTVKAVLGDIETPYDESGISITRLKKPWVSSISKNDNGDVTVAYVAIGADGYEIEYSWDGESWASIDTKESSVTIPKEKWFGKATIRIRSYRITDGQKSYSDFTNPFTCN